MFDSTTLKPAALIITSMAADRQLLAIKLQEHGFHVLKAKDGEDGIAIWAEQMCIIRLVITDLDMSPVDGLQVAKTIRDQEVLSTYIVVVNSTGQDAAQQDVLCEGVDASVDRPIRVDQLDALLHSVILQLRLYDHRDMLAGLVELAAERGGETAGHLQRTKRYCFLLADDLRRNYPELGLTEGQVQDIAEISMLHDIGKIGLPDGLLTKRGRYSAKEFEIIKDHTTIGGKLLMKLYQRSGSVFILLGYEMVMTHHEKWDGSGYPRGLKGEDIPLSGRIMAFADVYDALLSHRPYKDPMTLYHAEYAISEGLGRHFDPRIVAGYGRNRQRFIEINTELQESVAF